MPEIMVLVEIVAEAIAAYSLVQQRTTIVVRVH